MKEIIMARRSTLLRRNNSQELIISLDQQVFMEIFLINGRSFITKELSYSDLTIKPEDFYMIINNGNKPIEIYYNNDISIHNVIFDPYKYENSDKVNFKPEFFIENYNVPEGYLNTLPKWYSFKFIYPDYNLIFIRPEFGLSIQVHKKRNEFWEILEGRPIIINGNTVHYYVENGKKFQNPINTYHSVINPNVEENQFIVIKERWRGEFDENDIKRVFNPNNYY